MNEEFLQYIWANALFRNAECVTTGGEHIRILRVGEQNRHAGPDFFNARIEKNGFTLAGTVEIHLAGSDWKRHGHHRDPAYNNVILSVVGKADTDVYTNSGRLVDTIEIQYDERLHAEYLYMRGAPTVPRCHRRLRGLDPGKLELLLAGYAVERLQRKCETVHQLLEQTRGDWEATLLGMITRYWSGNVNADAFARLAREIPRVQIARHADAPFRVEALLLGCSGLLSAADASDEYVDALRSEYAYLSSTLELHEIPASCWRFARMRPTAFPTVRVALLSTLLCRSKFLLSTVLEADTVEEATRQLDVRASTYWDTHYRLGHPSIHQTKKIGKNTRHLIAINALVPFLFVHGQTRGEERHSEKALRWLEELPPEANTVTRTWQRHGITPRSALQTQALLQVHQEYCLAHRCLHCKLGHEIFKHID
jgi:hypothetical protein